MAKDYLEEMLGKNERNFAASAQALVCSVGNIILEIVLIIALIVISFVLLHSWRSPWCRLDFSWCWSCCLEWRAISSSGTTASILSPTGV